MKLNLNKFKSINITKQNIKIIIFSGILILFVYSGLIKNLTSLIFPIDITLGLFIYLFIIFFIESYINKIEVTRPFKDCMLLFTIIITMMIFSLFYSISSFYSFKKTLFFIILNIGSFIFAYFFVRSNCVNIKYIKLFFFFTSLIISLLFIYLYISGNIYYYFFGSNYKLYPDYLAISSYLAISVIINIDKNKIIYWIHRLFIISIIFILGARGPLLFLIFILITYQIIRFDLKKILLLVLIFTVFFIIALNTGIGERMINRLSNITFKSRSIYTRFELINHAVNIITTKPIFGVGIGGFGKYVTNVDGRYYPHNIFLEVTAENGLLAGFLWLLLFVYLFIYLFIKYKFKSPVLNVYFICLFLFLNTLKSSNLLDLRIMFFWFGIYIGLINLKFDKFENQSNSLSEKIIKNN